MSGTPRARDAARLVSSMAPPPHITPAPARDETCNICAGYCIRSRLIW
jgi:hypothetical protein